MSQPPLCNYVGPLSRHDILHIDTGLHEDLMQLALTDLPFVDGSVPLDIYSWKSTWQSVMEIKTCDGFEANFEQQKGPMLQQHRQACMDRDWAISHAVTKVVSSIATAVVAAPLGKPILLV